jgi:hypothetical protein
MGEPREIFKNNTVEGLTTEKDSYILILKMIIIIYKDLSIAP